LFFSDDDVDGDSRPALSDDDGGHGDDDKDDESWRVQRLEREKWIQGRKESKVEERKSVDPRL
jgi:hypothetical protein